MVSRRQRLELRAAVLQEQLGQLAEEIGHIAARPEEPVQDTIRFTKKFGREGRNYQYVARRGASDLWFVSGRVNSGRHTWDELLDFIEVDDPNALATVQVAMKWKGLVQP